MFVDRIQNAYTATVQYLQKSTVQQRQSTVFYFCTIYKPDVLDSVDGKADFAIFTIVDLHH